MFKDIPVVAWVTAIIAIFIIVFYVILKYFKMLGKATSGLGSIFSQTPTDYTGINLNAVSESTNYKAIADIQHNAMAGFGTNREVLFNSLEGLNIEELKVVFAEFGMRGIPFFKENLIEWYLGDLNNSELELMRVQWQGTGYTF